MLEGYLAELARFGDVDLDYPWFGAYWHDGEARWPYVLLDKNGHTAGFAMVNTHAPSGVPVDHAMAEFYVLPERRGAGTGRAAVRALLAAHPGTWELSVLQANHKARRFWSSALDIAEVTGLHSFEMGDVTIYRFCALGESPPAAQ